MPVRHTDLRPTYKGTYIQWTYFHQTPAMPTYLVAIMLSRFPNDPFKNISNFRYHTLQSELHTEFAKRIIDNVTLYFESEWMRFKKVPKVDHVIIPTFPHDGMENWGLIFYR